MRPPPGASSARVPTGNVYPKYDSGHRLERVLVSRFLRRLDQALPAAPPRRVLEVGMGEGAIGERVTRRFRATAVIGVDVRDEHLAAHWRERGLRGVFADAGSLPFGDRTFEVVLAIEVLEHLREPDRALSEIARVAGEWAVISVPREPLWRAGNLLRRRYWREGGNTPGHVQHWSARAFRGLVERHLQVVATWHPLPWTLVLAAPPHRPD